MLYGHSAADRVLQLRDEEASALEAELDALCEETAIREKPAAVVVHSNIGHSDLEDDLRLLEDDGGIYPPPRGLGVCSQVDSSFIVDNLLQLPGTMLIIFFWATGPLRLGRAGLGI